MLEQGIKYLFKALGLLGEDTPQRITESEKRWALRLHRYLRTTFVPLKASPNAAHPYTFSLVICMKDALTQSSELEGPTTSRTDSRRSTGWPRTDEGSTDGGASVGQERRGDVKGKQIAKDDEANGDSKEKQTATGDERHTDAKDEHDSQTSSVENQKPKDYRVIVAKDRKLIARIPRENHHMIYRTHIYSELSNAYYVMQNERILGLSVVRQLAWNQKLGIVTQEYVRSMAVVVSKSFRHSQKSHRQEYRAEYESFYNNVVALMGSAPDGMACMHVAATYSGEYNVEQARVWVQRGLATCLQYDVVSDCFAFYWLCIMSTELEILCGNFGDQTQENHISIFSTLGEHNRDRFARLMAIRQRLLYRSLNDHIHKADLRSLASYLETLLAEEVQAPRYAPIEQFAHVPIERLAAYASLALYSVRVGRYTYAMTLMTRGAELRVGPQRTGWLQVITFQLTVAIYEYYEGRALDAALLFDRNARKELLHAIKSYQTHVITTQSRGLSRCILILLQALGESRSSKDNQRWSLSCQSLRHPLSRTQRHDLPPRILSCKVQQIPQRVCKTSSIPTERNAAL